MFWYIGLIVLVFERISHEKVGDFTGQDVK